jgi:hypothetical protein
VIFGLDRVLARVRGREEDEPVEVEQRDPGLAVPDEELDGRIDAARVRLRAEIAPLED